MEERMSRACMPFSRTATPSPRLTRELAFSMLFLRPSLSFRGL
jgi:hypothetical protein